MIGNNQQKFLLIKNLIEELSRAFPNIKNDEITVKIWAKHLNRFENKSIELAKDRIIESHSGYLYVKDFIKLVKSFEIKDYKPDNKEIIPAKNIEKRLYKLISKLK
jgi:hypothetical protein